jgi:hypothetical protein
LKPTVAPTVTKVAPAAAAPLPTVPARDARTYRRATDDELDEELKLLDPLGTTPMDDAKRIYIEDEKGKRSAGFPALLAAVTKKLSSKKKK